MAILNLEHKPVTFTTFSAEKIKSKKFDTHVHKSSKSTKKWPVNRSENYYSEMKNKR